MADDNLLNQQNRRVGTGFTNLNRILQANKSNMLGQTIGQNLQSQSQQVREGLQSEAEKFRQKAEELRIGSQADVAKRDEVLGRFNAQSGFQGVQEPEIQQFQKFQSGQYKGPSGLEDQKAQELQGKAQQLKGLGQATLTSGGQQELLRRFAGGRGYTQGQQLMDTTLLGKSGQKDLAQARRSTLGMESDIQKQVMGARQLGQQYATEAKRFGEETSSRVAQMLGGQEQELIKQKEDVARQAQEQQDALRRGLAEESLTDDQLRAAGLNDQQIAQYKLFQDISGKQYATKARVEGAMYRTADPNMGGAELWGKAAIPVIEKKIGDSTLQQLGNKDEFIAKSMAAMSSLGPGAVNDPDLITHFSQEYDRQAGLIRDDIMRSSMYFRTGDLNIDENLNKYFSEKGFKPGTAEYSDLMGQLGFVTDPRYSEGGAWGYAPGSVQGFEYATKPDFEFERYLKGFDPANITKETVATQDQLMKANALRQLRGEAPLYDPSLAGTAQTKAQIDQSVFSDAVNALLGTGDVTYNEAGQIVPLTDRGAKMVSQALEGSVRLYSGGIGPEMYDALAKSLGLPEFDKYTQAGGEMYAYLRDQGIGGDLNPLKLTEDSLRFVANPIKSGFRKLGKLF